MCEPLNSCLGSHLLQGAEGDAAMPKNSKQ